MRILTTLALSLTLGCSPQELEPKDLEASDTGEEAIDPTDPADPTDPTDPTDPFDGEIQEFRVNHDGLDHFVRVAGSGEEVLIVINGGPGQSHHYCESAEVLASDKLRVVTYDQRGTGQTPHPNNANYHFDAFISDIQAIREALGVEQVHLLGHSFGGAFAIGYTATYPKRVKSLQLFSSSPVTMWDSDLAEFEARILSYEEDGTFAEGYNVIEGSNDCAPYFQTIWPVYLYDEGFPMTQGLIDTTCDLETFFGVSDSNWLGWDYENKVKKYEGRVGVYYGEADPFINESKSIPGYFTAASVEEHELSECGHYWEECESDFFSLAQDFLDQDL
jgi:pimeloyl-ACP methyl ester carboxylesterase